MNLPRKCCKQKTCGLAKPFRCNTYKKQGAHPSSQKFFSLLHYLDVPSLPIAKGSTHPRAIIGVAACDSAKKASQE